MKLNARLLAGVVCGIVVCAAQVATAESLVSTTGPFTDATIGLKFGDMAGFKFEKVTISLDDEDVYEVEYTTPFEGRLAVSVYHMPNGQIPDGPDSLAVESEVRRIQTELARQIAEKDNGTVRLLADVVDPFYYFNEASRLRTVKLSAQAGNEELHAVVSITGRRGYVVNIHAAYPASAEAQAAPEIERFLMELRAMLAQ